MKRPLLMIVLIAFVLVTGGAMAVMNDACKPPGTKLRATSPRGVRALAEWIRRENCRKMLRLAASTPGAPIACPAPDVAGAGNKRLLSHEPPRLGPFLFREARFIHAQAHVPSKAPTSHSSENLPIVRVAPATSTKEKAPTTGQS